MKKSGGKSVFNINNETKQLLADIIDQPALNNITPQQLDDATDRVHNESALTWSEKVTVLHAFDVIRRLKASGSQHDWADFQRQNEALISDLQNKGDSNIVLRLIEILINFFQNIFETQTTGDGHCFIHALVGEAQGGQYEKDNVSQYRENLYRILKNIIQKHLNSETLTPQEQAVFTPFQTYFSLTIQILSTSIHQSILAGHSSPENMEPWVKAEGNYELIPTELDEDSFTQLAKELAQIISSGDYSNIDHAMRNETIVDLIMQKEICETFVSQNLETLIIALARKEGSLRDQTVIIHGQTNRNSEPAIGYFPSLNQCSQPPINIELLGDHYARKDIVKAWRIRPQLFSSFTAQWNYENSRRHIPRQS